MRFFWLALGVLSLFAGIRSILLDMPSEEEKIVYIIGAFLLPIVFFLLAYRSHTIAKTNASLTRERKANVVAWEKLPKKTRRKLKKEQSEKAARTDVTEAD